MASLDHRLLWQQVGLVQHPHERDAVCGVYGRHPVPDASAQQAQESRLAVAVAPDDADAVALIEEADRDPVEDDTGAGYSR
jgi:hypothetical protein